jgi:hypothetical protein
MAAQILEAQPLSASEFNTIPEFERETTIGSDILRSFAEIFVARQMHLFYGIGLLHRHTTLPDGTGMVHSARLDNVDVCNIRRLDEVETNLTHNSLLLNKSSKFQAFEHDIGQRRSELDVEFLFHLRELILARGLTQLVAIIPVPLKYPCEDLFEFQLRDKTGMVTIPEKYLKEDTVELGRAFTTGWMFRETLTGFVEIIAMKKCSVQESGLHKVVKDRDVASLLESV